MRIFRPVTNWLQLIDFRRASPRLKLRRMSNSRTGISFPGDTRNRDRWWWSLTVDLLGFGVSCLICGVMLSIKLSTWLRPSSLTE